MADASAFFPDVVFEDVGHHSTEVVKVGLILFPFLFLLEGLLDFLPQRLCLHELGVDVVAMHHQLGVVLPHCLDNGRSQLDGQTALLPLVDGQAQQRDYVVVAFEKTLLALSLQWLLFVAAEVQFEHLVYEWH